MTRELGAYLKIFLEKNVESLGWSVGGSRGVLLGWSGGESELA